MEDELFTVLSEVFFDVDSIVLPNKKQAGLPTTMSSSAQTSPRLTPIIIDLTFSPKTAPSLLTPPPSIRSSRIRPVLTRSHRKSVDAPLVAPLYANDFHF
mmetsp:Transcript_42881/g.69557  ORF Transcript_42881/g.69557 Transcript_42881/m.69557 type:complete len:100 (+) Transcript_42881:982-1281(+)